MTTSNNAHHIIGMVNINTNRTHQRENNDCVVRAMTIGLQVDYDKAHLFVKNTWNRVNGKGTRYFHRIMADFIATNSSIHGCKFELLETHRGKTLGTFLKYNPTGRYILITRSHAIGVNDGLISDNYVKKGYRIEAVYKVITKTKKAKLIEPKKVVITPKLPKLGAELIELISSMTDAELRLIRNAIATERRKRTK